jgi:hypothetical protein
MYYDLARKSVMIKIDPKFENVDAFFRRKAELEFNATYPNLSGTERQEKKDAYITSYMLRNVDVIIAEKERRKEQMLKFVPKDIGILDQWFTNPKDINNGIIQEIDRILSEQEYNIQQESMFVVKSAEEMYRRYTDYFGKYTDQTKQYEPFLEQDADGKFTGKLVAVGSEKWDEIKNGKYKNTPVEEMYDFFEMLIKERDKKLPTRFKIGRKLPSMEKNFIEGVAEGQLFTAIKNRTVDAWKARNEDTDLGDRNDEEEGNNKVKRSLDDEITVLTNQAGEERRVVPIHFRRKIDPKDQSFDVLSLLVLDSHQAINYKHKSAVGATLEVMKDLTGKAKVQKRHGLLGLKMVKVGSKASDVEEGIKSKTYDLIEKMLANRLYGISMEGDPNLVKKVQSIKSLTSHVQLIANYVSAGANFLQGSAMNWIESAGGQFYGPSDLIAAQKKRLADLGHIVGDIPRRQDMSKTNLLSELFNVRSNWIPLESKFSENDAFKRILKAKTGHALSHMAEHMVQSLSMYAMLNNIKVKNENGDYIDKDGKVVEREKAMSLDEAYSVGYQNMETKETISEEAFRALSEQEQKKYMAGVLYLDPRVASTDRTDGVSQQDMHKVSDLLRRINRDLYGNYDSNNKSTLEMKALGSLVTHMRGWMVPGLKKRFKSGATLFMKDKEALAKFRTIRNTELREEDLSFNRATGQYEEGMYISTLRYLASVAEDIKALKFAAITTNWRNLTDLEKSNFKRTVTEMGMMVLTYVTYLALQAAAEDAEDEGEDSEALFLAALYSRRLYNELATYTSITEAFRTFRSPAVSANLLETMYNAIAQTMGAPLEEYDRGPNKGRNKAFVKWLRLTPIKVGFIDAKQQIGFMEREGLGVLPMVIEGVTGIGADDD